jgi:Vitamin K-dependent gamma-carboxylase
VSESVERFFFAPQSTSPMALLRVAWGAVAAVWAVTLLPDVDPFLTRGALRYDRAAPKGSWNLLDHIGWERAPLAACLLLVVAAWATMLGWRTRASALVAVLCMLSLQRTNPTIFNSGDLLLRQIGFAVVLAPSGLLWSLDASRLRRQGRTPNLLRAPWAMRFLQLEVAVGYALSAWAKVQGNRWQEGTALGLALRIEDLQRFAAPEWLYHQSVLLHVLTWATMAFEASFIVLVWNRRLRPWVLGVGVAFHLGIDVFFDIGFFSYAIVMSYLAFIPAGAADRLIARLRRGASEPLVATVPLPVEPAQ